MLGQPMSPAPDELLQVSTTRAGVGEEQMATLIALEGDLGDKGQK